MILKATILDETEYTTWILMPWEFQKNIYCWGLKCWRWKPLRAHCALRFQNRLSHKFRRNIETDLDNNSDYDEHPIRVAGVDICFVAEKIFFALNVNKELTKLSKEQKEALFAKFDDDTDRPPPQKKKNEEIFARFYF